MLWFDITLLFAKVQINIILLFLIGVVCNVHEVKQVWNNVVVVCMQGSLQNLTVDGSKLLTV